MREAHALKAAGRLDEAVRRYGEAVAANPRSGAAEHGLAACLGEDGRWEEAERHIAAAFGKGLDTPETWVVKARCEMALGRLDGADSALREALKRRGDMFEAQRELAQLIWMRTGEVRAAMAEVDGALARAPGSMALRVVKVQALEAAGDQEQAFAIMSSLSDEAPEHAGVAVQASQLATALGRSAEALMLAQRAQAAAPQELAVLIALTEALLATGEAQKASDLAADIRRVWSTNQHAIALQAAAWRMLGDPRYHLLFDYDGLVGMEKLDAPAVWGSLAAYLADVAKALHPLHLFVEHPFEQPVRHGSVVADIARHPHPALAALPRALGGAIGRHLATMDTGDDPARARNRGTYRLQGLRSVNFRPGGYCLNHVQPEGWLSAICLVEAEASGKQEGAIQFGQPGVRTHPMLRAEHVADPAPGMVLLFPSYMWHGIAPARAGRLMLAFDLAPGPVELKTDGR